MQWSLVPSLEGISGTSRCGRNLHGLVDMQVHILTHYSSRSIVLVPSDVSGSFLLLGNINGLKLHSVSGFLQQRMSIIGSIHRVTIGYHII